MRDRATIDIDCDAMTVSVNCGVLEFRTISGPIETTKASLIADVLRGQIRILMMKSKAELMQMHFDALRGDRV